MNKERAIMAEDFRRLGERLRLSLSQANSATGSTRERLSEWKAMDETELAEFLESEFEGIIGTGFSTEDLLADTARAMHLYAEHGCIHRLGAKDAVAAALLTIVAVKRGFLKIPVKDFVSFRKKKWEPYHPAPRAEILHLWHHTIVPFFRDTDPKRFPAWFNDDDLGPMHHQIVACNMISNLVDMKPDVDGMRYAMFRLRDMTTLTNPSLKPYILRAGLPTPNRGGRDHRFTLEEVKRILETIIKNCDRPLVCEKCMKSLESLNQTAKSHKSVSNSHSGK